jgi:tetratricopeptide (TPR) repeat protein
MKPAKKRLLHDAWARESRLWGPRETGALIRAEALLAAACRQRRRTFGAAAKAVRLAGAIQRRRPSSSRATGVLVAAHALRSNNYFARRAVERALRVQGGRPELLLLAARLSWKSDPAAALRLLDEAVPAAPEFGALHSFRGELLRRAGRIDEALAALARGIALNPEDPRPPLWRALARMAREPKKSRAELDALMRERPTPRVCAARGRLRERTGDARGAAADYSRALRLLEKRPELSEAIETLEPYEEFDAWLRYRRFAARAATGALNAALADLDAAHAADPKYGWSRASRDSDGAASALLETIRTRRPGDSRLLAWSGREALDRGDAALAETRLTESLTIDFRDGRTRAWRAEARLRLGRINEARVDARTAAAITPRYAPLWGVIAELELRRRRSRAAVAAARRAVQLYPHSVWGNALLGRALLAQGRRGESRRAFAAAAVLDAGVKA